ncbi:MAG: hypothetical protein PHR35_07905, partial [Kiritimatiellae bacterium]|nr:hypothetical protein [Kiritimatiellia bacterium]
PASTEPRRESRLQAGLLTALLLWCGVCAGASPLNQTWFIIRQDRFWVVKKPTSDLALLRSTGRWIATRVAPDQTLLTQDLYLAVEARRRVPSGFEMGPFGYFPELSDEAAARHHVLSRARLRAEISSGASPLAAFSGYGLALAAPAMTAVPEDERAELQALLSARYTPIRTVPDFGQEHTLLTLWGLR